MLNKTLALSLALSFIFVSAKAGIWTSYTNTDEARQIVPRGNSIWAATSGGIVAYDFVTGDIIKLTNIEGLKGIDFTCAEIDTSGSLWFGAAAGWLTKITPSGAIENHAFRDSIGLGRDIGLFDLKTDGYNLWVASDIGISRFWPYHNGGEIKDNARQLGNIPIGEDAICVNVVGNNLWAGTARGVAFINKDNENIQFYGNWRSFGPSENGLLNANVKSIVSYYDTVMIGTASGVFKLQVSPDTLWIQNGLSGDIVNSLYMSGSNLMAATNVGIFQFDGVNWNEFSSTGLPGGLAEDLILDGRGTLWAASPTSGLMEYNGSQWVTHTIPGPASNVIGRLAIDSSGGIWLPQFEVGVSRFYNGEWTNYNLSNSDPDGSGPLLGLSDNWEMGASVAPDGRVWISSYGGGLYVYDWTSWHHWNYTNSPMYGVYGNHSYWAARSVLADPSGNIWVSAFASDSLLLMGVLRPPPAESTWQVFYADEVGLTTNFSQSFLSEGNYIWVGRGDGLDRLDTKGTPFDISDDSWVTRITIVSIEDMTLDQSGTLWIASASGLFYLTPDADTVAKMEIPPEISGSASAVATDGVGNIWVGTAGGLGMLKPNRTEPNHSSWKATYTTANSPILGNSISDIAIDIPSGLIYIGTTTGLSVFDSGILPPSANLADMSAYPNPVMLGKDVQYVEFKRVPSIGTMSIYTASGDLVRQFDLSAQSRWDLRNSNGERVAGGIYFFHVRSGTASGTGKIAIIE